MKTLNFRFADGDTGCKPEPAGVDKVPISEIERAIKLREKYFNNKHKK